MANEALSIEEVVERTASSAVCVARVLTRGGVHVGDTVYCDPGGDMRTNSMPVVVEAIWKAGRSLDWMDAPHAVMVRLAGTQLDALEARGFLWSRVDDRCVENE